jgi:hypothetical protein
MYNGNTLVIGGVPRNRSFDKPFACIHVEALSSVMQIGLELSIDFHSGSTRMSWTTDFLKGTSAMPLETTEEPCTRNDFSVTMNRISIEHAFTHS